MLTNVTLLAGGAKRDTIVTILILALLVTWVRFRWFFLPDGTLLPFGVSPGCTAVPLWLFVVLVTIVTFAVSTKVRLARGEGASSW